MIDVTCAIIRNEDGEILVVQRGEKTDHPYEWEFPGGKIKKGESEEECILREVAEELSMEVVIVARLPEVEHDYGFRQIRLIPFICDTLDELPFLSEHMAYKWLPAENLSAMNFSGADIIVAEEYLATMATEGKNQGSGYTKTELSASEDEGLQDMINRMMSMKEVEWVAISAIENPEIFDRLMSFSYSDDRKLAFRASWTLTKVCDKYPEIIYPHMSMIIESLEKIDNEAVLRCFLRIISLSDIEGLSGKHHGVLAEQCFSLLKSGISAIAVKAYSMEILYKLVLKYPDLATELSATISVLLPEGSAGILSRGRQILKKLAGISPPNPPGGLKT